MEFSTGLDNFLGNKDGTYDWVIEASDLIKCIKENLPIPPRSIYKTVVLGAGTSTLSEELQLLTCNEITSLDVDYGCIEHMRKRCQDNNLLKWIQCDLTIAEPLASSLLNNQLYDLVIDKGTFDAILVEGTSYEFLANAYSLLSVTGYLIICSLHPPELIQQLLNISELNLKHEIYIIERLSSHHTGSSSMKGTVAICSINNHNNIKKNIDLNILRNQEKDVMDNYFQKQNPLINTQQELEIKNAFQNNFLEPRGYMDIESAHSLLFGNQSIDYTIDLFKEDLENWYINNNNNNNDQKYIPGYLNEYQLIQFVKDNQ